MQKLIAIIALICFINLVAGKYECKIPGWPDYYQNTYTTKCGYFGDPMIKYNYHYIYVNKSLSTLNPLIIKVGGGNGESSKVGLFEEFGPYLWDGNANFNAKENPYTWAQKAHLLFIDAPYETGYSYLLSQDWVGIYSDDDTAFKIASFIKYFLNDPEYQSLKKNRIFLQGQDNAGMFLPKVADILTRTIGIEVEGLMLGNPILSVQDNCDPESDRLPNMTLTYFANRDYLSPQLNRIWTTQQACQRSDYAAPRCRYLINRILHILDGINLYNINEQCETDSVAENLRSKKLKHELKHSCYPVCRMDKYKNAYLNNTDNVVALKADDLSKTGKDGYNIFDQETFDLYAERNPGTEQVLDVLARLIKNDTKVVIYSGLNDGDIPHLLVEAYVKQLADKVDAYSQGVDPFNCTSAGEQEKAPLGGWAERFSYGDGGFTYIKVKGAGRWVPAHFPEAGYEIMSRTVSETDPW